MSCYLDALNIGCTSYWFPNLEFRLFPKKCDWLGQGDSEKSRWGVSGIPEHHQQANLEKDTTILTFMKVKTSLRTNNCSSTVIYLKTAT